MGSGQIPQLDFFCLVNSHNPAPILGAFFVHFSQRFSMLPACAVRTKVGAKLWGDLCKMLGRGLWQNLVRECVTGWKQVCAGVGTKKKIAGF